MESAKLRIRFHPASHVWKLFFFVRDQLIVISPGPISYKLKLNKCYITSNVIMLDTILCFETDASRPVKNWPDPNLPQNFGFWTQCSRPEFEINRTQKTRKFLGQIRLKSESAPLIWILYPLVFNFLIFLF